MVQWKYFTVTDEVWGTFLPIILYWIYSGIYYLLQPLDGYRMHTANEEKMKNLVSRSTVVKGVLLQQPIQALVAMLLRCSSASKLPFSEAAMTRGIHSFKVTEVKLSIFGRGFVVTLISRRSLHFAGTRCDQVWEATKVLLVLPTLGGINLEIK